ncbi:Guanine nucleotide exchange factor DBS [Trichoplax sp. H2]|nr:Guanine nucleotide exchange factor DBS [Trichoplax sp. H2]|eukprot:RDD40896.1 Guanine nucleotide exchange factor DBS [Trichoplax sp. H2]
MNKNRKSLHRQSDALTLSGFTTPLDIREEEKKPIALTKVAPAIRMKFAYLTGTRTKTGCPILSMPLFNHFGTVVTDDLLKEVIQYFVDSTMVHSSSKRFAVVLDRRSSSWNSVKSLLRKLQELFGRYIDTLYLLKPQKMMSVLGGVSKSEFSFQIVLLNTIDELHQNIGGIFLTQEFGGFLKFDINTWLSHRTFVEDVESKARLLLAKINSFVGFISHRKSLISDKAGTLTETTEFLSKALNGQRSDYYSIVEKIKELTEEVRKFKDSFKDHSKESIITKSGINLDTISKINDLLARLSDTRNDFKKKWVKHEDYGIQLLKLYKFEVDLSEMAKNINIVDKELSAEVNLGDSIDHAKLLRKITTELQIKFKDTKMTLMKAGSEIKQLNSDDKSVESERLVTMWKELDTQSNKLEGRFKARLKALSDVLTLYEHINDVKKLQEFSVDHLNQKFKQKIQDCVSHFNKVTLASQRQSTMLDKLAATATEEKKLKSATKRSVSDSGPASYEPKSPLAKRKDSTLPSKTSTTSKANNSVPVTGDREAIISRLKEHLVSLQEDVDTETDQDILRKRSRIMDELINTERSYVNDLESVIGNYMKHFDEGSSALPTVLKGKKKILFGNLTQIYSFHHGSFLKALNDYRQCPALVGQCFLKFKPEFDSYSVYCQNRPHSDSCWETHERSCAKFFDTCKANAGHILPLNSYLLKPIQRITKYQLLLKDMTKCTGNSKFGSVIIKEALRFMLSLLERLNNTMHQMLITGFKGNLTSEGAILMQDSFQTHEIFKKSAIPANIPGQRKKYKPRHLFLFENNLLFTKKLVDEKQKKNVSYQFKSNMKLSKLGLTETVKGDQLAFELWLTGRERVVIVQAASADIKNRWVEQIRQLLLHQLKSAKGQARAMSFNAHKDVKSNQGQLSTLAANTLAVLPMFADGNSDAEDMWSDSEFADGDDEGFD